MLRFIDYFTEHDDNKEEERVFLERVASRTIIKGLRDVYDPGLDYLWGRKYDPVEDKDLLFGLIHGHFPEKFFNGVCQYFIISNNPASANDITVGSWLIRKKVDRMVEKLEDCSAEYYLDAFEQYLFVAAIKFAREEIEKDAGRARAYFNDFGYASVICALTRDFGYELEEAQEKAFTVTRFDEMLFDIEQEESLFFRDDDYEILFSDGFLNGLLRLKNYIGESLGYGYDYVCNIFADAHVDIPIDFIGTKEANQFANALQKERLLERAAQMYVA